VPVRARAVHERRTLADRPPPRKLRRPRAVAARAARRRSPGTGVDSAASRVHTAPLMLCQAVSATATAVPAPAVCGLGIELILILPL